MFRQCQRLLKQCTAKSLLNLLGKRCVATAQRSQCKSIVRSSVSRRQLSTALLSKRYTATSSPQLNFENIPGDFEFRMEDLVLLSADPMGFYNPRYELAQAFNPQSPMFKCNVFGIPSVILFSHDLVKQFQEAELRAQTRRHFSPHADELFGVTSNMKGKTHMNWKKGANPPFKAGEINKVAPIVQDAAQRVVLDGIAKQSQETGEFVQVYSAAQKFAFGVAVKFILGPYITEDEIPYAFSIWNDYAQGISPESMKDPECEDPRSVTSRAFRGRDALRVFMAEKFLDAEQLVLDGKWEEKWGDEVCIMKSTIEAGFDAVTEHAAAMTGKKLTLYNKMDILLGLTFAAYDTTSTSIANLVYSIWKHPEEAQKVRDAINAHPQLSDPNTVFSIDMLKGCNELECFVHETQRHHGIIPGITRLVDTPEGLDFGGITIPDGMGLLLPIEWLSHGPGSWTEAMEFKPSRFDKSKGQKKEERGDIGRYNAIPFALGIHRCLGMHLALLELRAYGCLLLRDWEFEVDESKLTADGIVAGKNLQGIPHYNMFVKMKKRE